MSKDRQTNRAVIGSRRDRCRVITDTIALALLTLATLVIAGLLTGTLVDMGKGGLRTRGKANSGSGLRCTYQSAMQQPHHSIRAGTLVEPHSTSAQITRPRRSLIAKLQDRVKTPSLAAQQRPPEGRALSSCRPPRPVDDELTTYVRSQQDAGVGIHAPRFRSILRSTDGAGMTAKAED